MREGARRLARAHRRVDPALLEEVVGDLRHARGEARVSREHGLTRLAPGKNLRRRRRQGGVAVPIIERVLAEPFRLELVIAVRKLGMRRLHGGDERRDNVALDAVGKMPRIGDVLEMMPAVGDFLVLGQRIADQRKGAQMRLQSLADRFRRRAAGLLLVVLQEIEHGLDRERLALHVKTQAGDGLVEQAMPGRGAGERFLMEKLFELFFELMRLFLADVIEPGAPARKRRLCGGCVQNRIVDAIELQLEEQELRRGVDDLAARVCVEFRADRVRDVAGVQEAGERHDAAEEILQLFVSRDGGPELLARAGALRQCGELAAIFCGKSGGFARRAREIGGEGRRVGAVVKISEIPFGQSVGGLNG